MEHLGLCTVEQIEYAAKLNLALSFFVAHLYFYGTSYTKNIFGPERTNRWTPLSAATKAGLRWSIHQDHATFPGLPLPFANIKTAVTRTQRGDKEKVYGPEYCVTIHQAMKPVTIDAAWQLHKDDCLGSLRMVPTIVTAHIFCACQGSRARRERNVQHAGHADWFCLL